MPMIFSPELAGESYHISSKAEMVESGVGRKGEALSKNRDFRKVKGNGWKD